MSKDGTLRLNLEPELLKRIDDLMEPVSNSEAVQELGTRVSRHLVSRIALLRGIKLMEQQYNEGEAIVSHDKPAVAPQPVAPVQEEQKKPEKKPELNVVHDDDGFIQKPDGWDLWTSDSVPAGHQQMHSYYVANGWGRYTGKSGKEIITFYWCNDPSLQDIDVWDGPDKNGKQMMIQKTPYGPGHMIPHGYTA